MKRKFPEAICPRCNKPAYEEQEIEKKFGHRLCEYIYRCRQSWCKECVIKRKIETIRDLRIRQLKNKFLMCIISIKYSKLYGA